MKYHDPVQHCETSQTISTLGAMTIPEDVFSLSVWNIEGLLGPLFDIIGNRECKGFVRSESI